MNPALAQLIGRHQIGAGRTAAQCGGVACRERATPVAHLLMLFWTASLWLAHERAGRSQSARV
jgi:hypothetical protein